MNTFTFNVKKLYSPITTACLLLLFFCFGAAASETPPESSKGGEIIQKAEPVSAAPIKEKTTSPPAVSSKSSSLSWWAAGLAVVVLIAVILYFLSANMERKTSNEFETTIIDDIVSAIKPEYAGIQGEELRRIVAAIIADHRCSDRRLDDLLRIDYEVEKVDSSRIKRTTAVAIRRQGDLIKKKVTRTLAWEDLPKATRSEFIMKNEKVLVYSLYSVDGKEV